MKRFSFILLFSLIVSFCHAQPDRWQQKVKYVMDIDMNVQTNRFTGKQKLEYWNNSPDTLTRVFYHLYFNAFQPGSMMDTRSRRQGTIQAGRGADWDPRVKDGYEFKTGRNRLSKDHFVKDEWSSAEV